MTRPAFRIVLGVLAAALAALPFVVGGFAITLLNYVGIYALAALGLVLLTGMGGLTSFGQAAFVGIGAYASAYLTTAQGLPPLIGLVAAVATTGGVALLLGAVTLKLGGHFLPLSTIAWGIAISLLFGNIEALGRHNGIANIPPVSVGPVSFFTAESMYYLVGLTLAGAMWLSSNLLDSREGRAIRSLRSGAAMVESLGISVFRTRLAVFVIAGIFAGISGWLYAHMQRFISPAPFELRTGIEYLLMAVAGGSGHILGAVVGAALITFLKSVLQDVLPLLTSNSAQLEIVIYGCLFILLLQYARGGVIPFILRLAPKRRAPPPARITGVLPKQDRSAPDATMLEIVAVTKRFGGLVAVNEVSLKLRAGEILGLIGPNGAGKSTLFNAITGTDKPSSGKIVFRGRDVTHVPARKIAALGMARTFQHVKLRPNMSLLENVALGAYLRSRCGFLGGALRLARAEEAAIRADAMRQLERVGLADRFADLAGNLPLASQRLLEIARSLAADPVLLVLDEPAAGLRRMEKEALASLLHRLREEGLTILLVEHDMDFVMNLVDRLVVLDFGSKLAEGPPSQIRANLQVQQAYLGVAA